MQTQTLIANFITGLVTDPTESDQTEAAILDATGVEIGQHGFAKASLDSIAKRAGVNRVTIYRRFDDRDGLLATWARREGFRMAAELASAVSGQPDLAERTRRGFVTAIGFFRQNPVVRSVARDDPAAFIAMFCADNQGLLRLGGSVVAREIRGYQKRGHALELDAEQTGEAIARLVTSCVLIPGGLIDIDDPAAIRSFAESTLIPMLTSTRGAAQ